MADGVEDQSLNGPAETSVELPLTAAEQRAQGRASAAELQGNRLADAERKRLRQALELQRERVLSERTSNPHRRTALETALADIEERLGELGWTIHL